MSKEDTSGRPKKIRMLKIIPLACVFCILCFLFIYVSSFYRADAVALAATYSDDTVTVQKTEYGWLFDGPSEDRALIFYPGAKVEAESYAPLLHRLSEKGIDVCLVRMPCNLAILGVNKATDVMDMYDYSEWYIGGHSMGGAMAARYASDNPDRLTGLIMLAAYPTSSLSSSLNVISITGSEDGVIDRDNLIEGRVYITGPYTEHVIRGGNHAQFGSYGLQDGDGTSYISTRDQIEETVSVILCAAG